MTGVSLVRVYDAQLELLHEGRVTGSPAVEVGRLARSAPWGPRMHRWTAEPAPAPRGRGLRLLAAAALGFGIALAVHPTEAAGPEPTATGNMAHSIAASQTRQTPTLGVDLPTSTPAALLKVSAGDVNPGDMIRIYADAGVTNDTGRAADRKVVGTRFIVGVGFHIAAGSCSNRIGQSLGENVTPDVHHLALNISRLYEVPATWTPGEPLTVMLCADAHSTAWNVNAGKSVLRDAAGLEVLKVDNYGQIVVDRWAAS